MRQEQRVFVVTQQEVHEEEQEAAKSVLPTLYSYGTVTVIQQLIKLPENVIRVLAVGEYRAQFLSMTDGGEYFIAEAMRMPEGEEPTKTEKRSDAAQFKGIAAKLWK